MSTEEDAAEEGPRPRPHQGQALSQREDFYFGSGINCTRTHGGDTTAGGDGGFLSRWSSMSGATVQAKREDAGDHAMPLPREWTIHAKDAPSQGHWCLDGLSTHAMYTEHLDPNRTSNWHLVHCDI